MSDINTDNETKVPVVEKSETFSAKIDGEGKLALNDPLDDDEVITNFRISYENPYPTIYSNIARVSHNQHDVCIDFALIAPPQPKAHEELVLRTVGQVFIPNGMAANLIGILFNRLPEDQKERIVKEFGNVSTE